MLSPSDRTIGELIPAKNHTHANIACRILEQNQATMPIYGKHTVSQGLNSEIATQLSKRLIVISFGIFYPCYHNTGISKRAQNKEKILRETEMLHNSS